MSSESSKPAAKGIRSLLKWSGIALAIVAALSLALVAATPWLISQFAPHLAGRFGLDTVEIVIGYPGLNGVDIEELHLESDAFAIRGKNARIAYSWSQLRAGVIDSLGFESLELSLFSDSRSAGVQPTRDTDQIIPNLPFQHLQADRLVVKFPDTGFVGIGKAQLGDGQLSFSLDGVEPEVASRFRVAVNLTGDGIFSARFGERDGETSSFLTLQGTLANDTMSIDGQFTLSGFALELARTLAGLPAGTGTVAGRIRTQLPWPLPDTLSWRDISASLSSLSIDWQSQRNELELTTIVGSVNLDRGRVSATLSGDLRYKAGARIISARLPDNYRLIYGEGMLTGGSGLRLRMTEPDSDTKTTLRSFSWVPVLDPRLDFDADVDGRFGSALVNGRFRGRLSLPGMQPALGSGRMDFSGVVGTRDQRHQGNVSAKIALSGNALRADGTLTSGFLDTLPFVAEYDLDSGAGRFSATDSFDFDAPVAAEIVSDWEENYDLDAGHVDATLKLNWRSLDTVAADLELTLTNGTAHYETDRASGIAGRLHLLSTDVTNANTWKLEPTRLNIKHIDVGIPIENLTLDLSWEGDRIDVSSASAALLGGRATATPFSYRIATGSSTFDLALDDISLEDLLALEGDDVTGTGALKGRLPVVVRDDKARIENGSVHSLAPGGVIRLTSQFSGPSGQPGVDFALLALKDFNYTSLSAEIDYAENGDLDLAVHLQGRNPAVEQGRPIRYNLNISENIPVLLESLRLQDRLTEKIEAEVTN